MVCITLAAALLATTPNVYAAPVIYQPAPQVIYQAGANLELQALVAREVRAGLAQGLAELRAELRAPVAHSNGSANGKQIQPVQTSRTALETHCAKCHRGTTPKGGLVFDGTTPVEARHITAALKQIRGDTMPKDHKLDPQTKGAIMEELFQLEADPLPAVVPRRELRPSQDLPLPPPPPPPTPIPQGNLQ